MDVAVHLPVVKGDIRFVYLVTEMRLVVDFTDFDGRERIEFVRKSGKWRWVGGQFVSVHKIASMIFQYRDNPSLQEMEWMGGYVEDIGRLIDTAYQVIKDGAAAMLKEREEMQKQMPSIEPLSVARQSSRDFVCKQKKTLVYLMRHANGLTKIGRSNNPHLREKTLQAEDPRLEMFFHCEADASIERRLHQIFNSVRVRGEWFDLMPHHVEWVTSVLKNMNGLSNQRLY